MNNNYLPFDLEKALAGEPYGAYDPNDGTFYKAEFPPHQLPNWHNTDLVIKANGMIWQFNAEGMHDLNFRLVMLPPEPKVEYRYANEYANQTAFVSRESTRDCDYHANGDFNTRIGIIRYTYIDGRLAPELTVRIEDYRK